MSVLSPGARTAALETLPDTDLDLLVIGGGITGAGIARDAAQRGLRTALVEKVDFAAGCKRSRRWGRTRCSPLGSPRQRTSAPYARRWKSRSTS